jgi:hypothetical protein
MKPKKLNKNLKLNKKTIVHLSGNDMKELYAGIETLCCTAKCTSEWVPPYMECTCVGT